MGMNRRGQFLPISVMVMTTSLLFLGVVVNVFRVAKAKLEAQNLADAAALAVASMQSKSMNVIVDRNEWMNHIYAKGQNGQDPNKSVNPRRIPPISLASRWNAANTKIATEYARLVQNVNQTQVLFRKAYNNFIGAPETGQGSGAVPTQSQGANSLHDILSEIRGLREPGVKIAVWNSSAREQEAQSRVDRVTDEELRRPPSDEIKVESAMDPLIYKTIPITIRVDGKPTPLKSLLGSRARAEDVGWMRLDTEASPTFTGRGSGGGSKKLIGVGARVAKRVKGLFGLPGTTVHATSYAYLVENSGVPGMSSVSQKPPEVFRPTYYVQLGNK